MDFKVDQNLPEEVVQILRNDGHDARNVYEEQLDGRPDPEIVAAVSRESRALITLDLDLADLRSYPPEQYSGLLVSAFTGRTSRRYYGRFGQSSPCYRKRD